MFKSLHPSETAKKDGIKPHFKNARDYNDPSQDYLTHCKQCGHTIDLKRDVQGGFNVYTYTYDSDTGAYTRSEDDGGCPGCHSRNSI